MSLFENLFRREVERTPEVPSTLCLLSLVEPQGDPPRAPGQVQSAADPGEIQRLTGLTPQQFHNMLQNDLARSVFIAGAIQALDSDDYDQRTQAAGALRLALNSAPHQVLHRLLEAARHPLTLEHQRRLRALVEEYLAQHPIQENGVTNDAIGRITRVSNSNSNVLIRWNDLNLNQIDSLYVDGAGVDDSPNIIERQSDGNYQIFTIPRRSDDLVLLGIAGPNDVRVMPGNPPILVYQITDEAGASRQVRVLLAGN